MAAVKKLEKKGSPKKAVVISKKVKDYGNDPFFVKKAKSMESILKKHRLPNLVARA